MTDNLSPIEAAILQLATEIKTLQALVVNINVALGIEPPWPKREPTPTPWAFRVDDDGDAFHGVAVERKDGE